MSMRVQAIHSDMPEVRSMCCAWHCAVCHTHTHTRQHTHTHTHEYACTGNRRWHIRGNFEMLSVTNAHTHMLTHTHDYVYTGMCGDMSEATSLCCASHAHTHTHKHTYTHTHTWIRICRYRQCTATWQKHLHSALRYMCKHTYAHTHTHTHTHTHAWICIYRRCTAHMCVWICTHR